MSRWIRSGKTIMGNGEQTIRYESYLTPCMVESRRRAVKHANGIGDWFHTTYVVIYPDGAEKECWSLKAAQRAAESVVAR